MESDYAEPAVAVQGVHFDRPSTSEPLRVSEGSTQMLCKISKESLEVYHEGEVVFTFDWRTGASTGAEPDKAAKIFWDSVSQYAKG